MVTNNPTPSSAEGDSHEDADHRLTPLQSRYAYLRALYPKNTEYPDWKCAELAGSTAKEPALKNLASRFNRLPGVKQIIAEARGKQIKRLELEADEVVEGLRETRDVCLGRRPAPQTIIVDDEPQMVEGYQFIPSGANKSLELLGRHIDMFVDKSEINVSGQVTLNIYMPDNGR